MSLKLEISKILNDHPCFDIKSVTARSVKPNDFAIHDYTLCHCYVWIVILVRNLISLYDESQLSRDKYTICPKSFAGGSRFVMFSCGYVQSALTSDYFAGTGVEILVN